MCGWKGPLWIMLREFGAAVTMKRLESSQGKQSKQSNQELRGIVINFSILEKKAHQNGVISGASNALAKISDVECVGLFGPGQATWSSEHGIRHWKQVIKVSSQVFQSTWKYFTQIKPTMRAHDICIYLSEDTTRISNPQLLQRNWECWETAVCLVARVNSHACWCIEIAWCNHR